MGAKIEAETTAIDNCAKNIENAVSDIDVGFLADVGADNTRAERGICDSFSDLKETFEDFKKALMADANNLRVAGELLKEADAKTAGNF